MTHKERILTNCKCGNAISYVDIIDEGGRMPEWYIITCNRCKNEFIIKANSIVSLEGGIYTISSTVPHCPFCELKPSDLASMTNDDSKEILCGNTGIWCEKHSVAYTQNSQKPELTEKKLLGMIINYGDEHKTS